MLRTALLLSLFWCMPPVLCSQTPPAARPETLTLEEAASVAMKSNRQVKTVYLLRSSFGIRSS